MKKKMNSLAIVIAPKKKKPKKAKKASLESFMRKRGMSK